MLVLALGSDALHVEKNEASDQHPPNPPGHGAKAVPLAVEIEFVFVASNAQRYPSAPDRCSDGYLVRRGAAGAFRRARRRADEADVASYRGR